MEDVRPDIGTEEAGTAGRPVGGEGPGPERERPLVSDRIYGAVGVAAVLLALFFLVRGGPSDDGTAPGPAVPRLELLEPAAGAVLAQPVTVAFDAGTALSVDGSDADGRLHVHVRVGRYELMSGPGSLQPLGGTRYRWTLPTLPTGPATVRLYWSDASHRPLAEGASDSAAVTIR